MDQNDLLVRFWGVRGSHPVPGKNTIRFGGNTSCVEIRAQNHIIILDAGTGIINLGNALLAEMLQTNHKTVNATWKINLFISHTHHDHIQGIPFFAPAYQKNSNLNIYGPKSFSQELSQILSGTMQPQYSPIEMEELNSQLNIQNMNENQVLLLNANIDQPQIFNHDQLTKHTQKDVVVKIMRSYAHPKVGVFIFRVEINGKHVVYATDTEGYVGGDTRLIEFAKDADLLIHDAQYDPDEYMDPDFPKQGFGHSTYEMAAYVAKTANVKQLVLFHHDPSHDDDKIADMEAKTKKIFANTTAGAEGLEFRF